MIWETNRATIKELSRLYEKDLPKEASDALDRTIDRLEYEQFKERRTAIDLLMIAKGQGKLNREEKRRIAELYHPS